MVTFGVISVSAETEITTFGRSLVVVVVSVVVIRVDIRALLLFIGSVTFTFCGEYTQWYLIGVRLLRIEAFVRYDS